MSLLVRKINIAKWMQNDIKNGDDISADAITNCLKTSSNELSVWQTPDDTGINDAVLAIVSAQDRFDKIDVVCLESSELTSKGINFESSPDTGRTALKDFIDKHVNIVDLTYNSLGALANSIVEIIKEDKVLRFTVGESKKLVKKSIKDGRIKESDLKDSLRDKLVK